MPTWKEAPTHKTEGQGCQLWTLKAPGFCLLRVWRGRSHNTGGGWLFSWFKKRLLFVSSKTLSNLDIPGLDRLYPFPCVFYYLPLPDLPGTSLLLPDSASPLLSVHVWTSEDLAIYQGDSFGCSASRNGDTIGAQTWQGVAALHDVIIDRSCHSLVGLHAAGEPAHPLWFFSWLWYSREPQITHKMTCCFQVRMAKMSCYCGFSVFFPAR